LELRDTFITAICRCAPPDNKPTPQEQLNCRPFLARELALLKRARIVVALGRIGLDGYLRLLREQGHAVPHIEFRHGAIYRLEKLAKVHRNGNAGQLRQPRQDPLPTLVCSYHPSRQNTQTGRLTAAMMDTVVEAAKKIAIG
ncbi:MAG TPA: uracil-DNA glycosylase family protein, partial [Anaerolineae bacterium]